MEDIFDNLLYIVITIAAFAISAIGKKKKQQARKGNVVHNNNIPDEPQQSQAFNIESLIKEELGLKTEEFIQEPEVIQNETLESFEEALDTVPKHMLDDKEDIPYSIEYDNTNKISDIINEDELTKEDVSEESILADFSLQKAIIYSEIINRKEF